MTTQERIEFKERIQKEIEKTEQRILSLEGSAKPIAPDDAIGRISRMDAINNKSVIDAAIRTAKRKLGKLNEAVKKVNQPEFGACRICKRPIHPKRLMLMPQSAKCVRCAS